MASTEIIVRPLRPEDGQAIFEMRRHPEVMRHIMTIPSMEYWQIEDRMSRRLAHAHRYVAELNGEVVGQAMLLQVLRARRQHAGDIGLEVHPKAWRQGVGTALMRQLLEIADNWLDLKRIQLEVFTDNVAAQKLYQKLGFEIEGERQKTAFGAGKYQNDYVMSRLRGSYVPNEEPPARLEKMRGKRPFAQAIIRPPLPSDLDDLYPLFQNPANARTTLQMPSQELWQAKQRLEFQNENLHRFLAEVDGRAVGIITLNQRTRPRQRHVGGLGMMVSPEFWGAGIGSQLMAAVVDLADNWLNLARIELDVNVDNPAAVKLYEKFGFVIEGRKRMHGYGDGRWGDSFFMGRVRG